MEWSTESYVRNGLRKNFTEARIIDNGGHGFEEKIKRAYNAISRVVDLPEAPILTKKFLLQKVFKVSNLP